MKRYNFEQKKQKIAELNDKLVEVDEESDEYDQLIREIADLQKT